MNQIEGVETGTIHIPSPVVRKHNLLIEAAHTQLLDVRAMRLVALASSRVSPSDKDFKTYHLPVKEISRSSDVYRQIEGTDSMQIDKITDQLVTGILKLPAKNQDGTKTGESWTKYAYFTKCKYVKGSGYIEVQFHPDLKEFYLDLKSNYTQFSYEILRTLPSSYSFRLYELLRQYAQGGLYRRKFHLPALFDMLAIKPDGPKKKSSYRKWAKFREKVILPAQANFERFTDLTFEFKGLAEGPGRKFDHIIFITKKNKKFFQGDLFKQQSDEPTVIDLIPESVMTMIPPAQWSDKTIGCEKVVTEILDSQGIEAVQFYVDYTAEQDQKTKIESWGKYIRAIWKDKLYEAHYLDLKKKAEAKKADEAQKAKENAQLQKKAEEDRKIKEETERLNTLVDEILTSGDAEQFLSFVEEQVRVNESQYVGKRFREDRGGTRQEMFRRYLEPYKETFKFVASDPQEDENYSLVDWLELND